MATGTAITIASAFGAAIIGALATASFSVYHARIAARRDRTIRLCERFHSEALLRSRRKADAYLRCRTSAAAEAKPAPDDNQSRALSHVLHFFEEAWILSRDNHVDAAVLAQLLGRYVEAWESCVRWAGLDLTKWGALVDALNALHAQVQRYKS